MITDRKRTDYNVKLKDIAIFSKNNEDVDTPIIIDSKKN